MTEQMRLCAFIMATGHHVASWRAPGIPLENGTNFAYWANLARISEDAKLDAIFLYDGAAISNIPIEPMSHGDRATFFDPMTLLPALAVVTSKIGLVATSPPPPTTSPITSPGAISRWIISATAAPPGTW